MGHSTFKAFRIIWEVGANSLIESVHYFSYKILFLSLRAEEMAIPESITCGASENSDIEHKSSSFPT